MPQQPPRKRRFHFEAMWTKREDCKDIIKDAWNGCRDLSMPSGLANGLRQCAIDLSLWNKLVFGQVPKLIQNKRNTLNALVLRDRDVSLGSEINR